MKNLSQKLFATALILASVSTASAFERETGGRMLAYRTEYQCFNRAQLTDAPMVEILIYENDTRAVRISNRGNQSVYGLKVVSSDENGTTLENQHLSATLAADGLHAEVTLESLNLTYQCELKK